LNLLKACLNKAKPASSVWPNSSELINDDFALAHLIAVQVRQVFLAFV
jgi:hypothetical protein